MNSNQKVSQALAHTGDCPALDQLIELLAAKDPATEAHLGACPHCTTELALYREFQQPAVRPEEKADIEAIVARLRQNSPVPKAAWWTSLWSIKFMAPASVAMAAVLVGLFLWVPSQTNLRMAPHVSGGDDAMRSARVEILSPTGTLLDAPSKLEWQAVRGATSYRISLEEVDRTAVWSGTVDQTSVSLSPEVRAKVVPSKTFLWQVLAVDAKGAVIGDSGAQRFKMEKRSAQ